MDYLEVEELKPCYLYRIKARNGTVGIWDPDKGHFLLSRYKFGDNFTFGEIHWDLDTSFGTVKPWEELEETPFTLDQLKSRIMVVDGKEYWGNPAEEALLEYLNMWEHKLDDPHPKERFDG
jgi:hypothetical protein